MWPLVLVFAAVVALFSAGSADHARASQPAQPSQPARPDRPPGPGDDADDVPRACRCKAEDQRRLLDVLGPALSKHVRICNTVTGVGCDIEVPVVQTTGSQCMGMLQYCVLCVVTPSGGTAQHQPRWHLTENGQRAKKHRFKVDIGIDIVGASGSGKVHFQAPRYLPSGDTGFTWLPAQRLGAQLHHWSRIEMRRTGESCAPYDPIIVNTDQ